jgi:hypothetical protein
LYFDFDAPIVLRFYIHLYMVLSSYFYCFFHEEAGGLCANNYKMVQNTIYVEFHFILKRSMALTLRKFDAVIDY